MTLCTIAWLTSFQLDLVQDVDIRQPSIHRGEDMTWVTDYYIGSHNYHTVPQGSDNDLSVFVGSNEWVVGDVRICVRSINLIIGEISHC